MTMAHSTALVYMHTVHWSLVCTGVLVLLCTGHLCVLVLWCTGHCPRWVQSFRAAPSVLCTVCYLLHTALITVQFVICWCGASPKFPGSTIRPPISCQTQLGAKPQASSVSWNLSRIISKIFRNLFSYFCPTSEFQTSSQGLCEIRTAYTSRRFRGFKGNRCKRC